MPHSCRLTSSWTDMLNGCRPPYLLSTHDVKVEGDIVFLPLYMSGLLAS